MAALSLSACLAGWAGQVSAQDTDGDGLTDAEEKARVRTAPFGAQQVITTTAGYASSVYAVDLDGDGDPDVLSASGADSKIAWYENRLAESSADFGPQQVITIAASGAQSVFAADLDGDGDPDVLSASGNDGKIAWYENRHAYFGPQRVITTAHGVDSVFAADLDGDGDPDVLSASWDDGKIAWYENRLAESSANFGGQRVITTIATYARSVFATDLDGDGDPDVLSASCSGIAWYENRLNESSANFGTQRVITTASCGIAALFAADLDGDGDPDVLSADGGKIAWYENRLAEPSADFGAQQVITTLTDLAYSVFAADLDGDGDPDVLSASYRDDKIAWYENRLEEATRDFAPQRVITTAADGARSVFAVDLDADGALDVLSASSEDDKIAWYANPATDPADPDSDDDGLSDGEEVNVRATDPLDPDTDDDGLSDGDEVGFRATDPLDPDSDDDGLSDGSEALLYGTDPNLPDTDADGLRDDFEVAYDLDPLVAGEGPLDPDLDGLDNLAEQAAGTDPHVPDSDEDGLSDGDELSTYSTDPINSDTDRDGLLDGAEVTLYSTDPLRPDTDDDGIPDGPEVNVYRTNPLESDTDGDGLSDGFEVARARTTPFGPPQTIGPIEFSEYVLSADLDGDGDRDVISASSDKIAWYENQLSEATGAFGSKTTIATGLKSIRSISVADLDGDGDPDVLFASYSDGKVAWYENRLNELTADFGPQRVITTAASGARAVYSADLDGDGDLDVLSASDDASRLFDHKIVWYENRLNEASADFALERVITREAEWPSSVFASDLDGDGDLDVLATSSYYTAVSWYENRLEEATRDFAPQRVLGTINSAIWITAVDLDEDGDPDVLSASEANSQGIYWNENRLNEATADFTSLQPIGTLSLVARSAAAVDVDGDGDFDVLSTPVGDSIAWYENRLREPPGDLGPYQLIARSVPYARSVFGADLNGDGNPDVLAGGSSITWYANPGTNPLDPDTDRDGLSDGDEVNVYSTDPLDTETDGDGIDDGDEVLIHGTDPADRDTDDDGLLDGEEILARGTDPLDPDTDGDGLRDGFEVKSGFDPLQAGEEGQDPDLDGLVNLAEQMAGADPLNPDSDGDDLSDGDEVSVHTTDPADPDTDGDGLRDGFEVAHGFDPRTRGERAQDPDFDGLVNLSEQTAGTDPLDPDSDDDGLLDGEEIARVRTVPFGPTPSIVGPASAGGVYTADFDGDGDLDVLSPAPNSLRWYENRLDEVSADFAGHEIATGASYGFPADLDGDGDPDIVSGNGWFENRLNEGSADFGPKRTITSDDWTGSVADLDGDGDLDFYTSSAWYENRLNEWIPGFVPKRVPAPNCCFRADLDGDGDTDLLTGDSWLANRLDEPTADFGPPQLIAPSGGIWNVADMDADGDLDVISTRYWHENRLDEASADFGPQQLIPFLSDRIERNIFQDIDGDGDADVFNASFEYRGSISWYENRLPEATANFIWHSIKKFGHPTPRAISVADLDGDGDPDVIASFSTDNKIWWYENPGTDPLDPDSDDDGVLDGDEVHRYATDPHDPDSDDDGLSDGEELFDYATDPTDSDSDDDGLIDGDEVNVYGTDPNAPDTDTDGLLDGFEVTYGFDPLVTGDGPLDPDRDGLDNLAEQAAGTDPLDPDTDGDHLLDAEEINVFGTDPLNRDTDNGGVSDGREVRRDGTDPLNPYDDILIGLYSISRWDPYLRVVDENTGWVIWELTVPITLDGAHVYGGNGLATNPLTGELWALLQTDYYGQGSRVLVTIDPLTGIATAVGNTGDNFAGLAFDGSGVLYGVTGDGASVPESLFTLSLDDGSATFLTELGNGTEGEAIAFHDGNGLLYHASGCCVPNEDQIFESVDLDTLAVTPIPLSGFASGPMRALTYDGADFLGAGRDIRDPWGYGYSYQEFVRLSVAGEAESIGLLDHISKGLAFVFVDSDQDGLTDVKELQLGTDPDNPDSDADGFPDGEEATLGTDPANPNQFPIVVEIDIKPGSDANPLNAKSSGVLPIALLGSESFDVNDVNGTSLRLGAAGARPKHDLSKTSVFADHLEDVNGDGLLDLISHYRAEEVELSSDGGELCLVGKTQDRRAFKGCDAIDMKPQRRRAR